jgi:transcription antitermination factor NusG
MQKHVLSGGSEALPKTEVSSNSSGVTGILHMESARSVPDLTPQWFAAYTTTRHEKVVAEHLAHRNIESFLPLYRSLRLWKNGCKVNVERPLFPSYLFVRIERKHRVRVLEVPGVLSLVSTGGKPVPLPEPEIEALRAAIPFIKCEPHPYLVIGEI